MNEETLHNRVTWPLRDAVGRYLSARQTGNDVELRFAEMRASYYEDIAIARLEGIQHYHTLARKANKRKDQAIRDLCEADRTIERLTKELEKLKGTRFLGAMPVID